MKKILFLCLTYCASFSQTQIGDDINGEIGSISGRSVSLSSNGTIVAIGAEQNNTNGNSSGAVRIYQNNSGIWTQLGNDINGEAALDRSGYNVSLSSNGNIVAIGATGNDGNGNASGHVRIYQYSAGVWTQIGSDIDGEAEGDTSGNYVSLSSDGTIVAIGATGNDGNGNSSGHVRIYQNSAGTWTQVGNDIDGEFANDQNGSSVSLSSSGNIVAIGATGNGGNGTNSGHVRIYQNNAGTWTQIGADINGEAAFNSSGYTVKLSSDGSKVAISAPFNSGNGAFSGHVRIYQNSAGTWTQVGNDINGEAADDYSGTGLSMSDNGNIVAIGAATNDGNGSNSGHVRIYQNISGVWTQVGNDINGEAADDNSGVSVSLSNDGSTLAIGAYLNDGNGSQSGHVRVYGLSELLSTTNFILSNFSIYPNPTSDVLNITLEEDLQLEKVIIYNTSGQIIKNEKSKIINVSSLSKGTYLIEVVTNQGKATKSFIIE